MDTASSDFRQLCSFANLLQAWRDAARGKRSSAGAAAFEDGLAERLLELHETLASGEYRPGRYTHFTIHEPKRRRISAAPFRDRVVHHALCGVIEPVFEVQFIADSYANRAGKGTHRAIDRLQHFARRRQHHQLDVDPRPTRTPRWNRPKCPRVGPDRTNRHAPHHRRHPTPESRHPARRRRTR